MSCSLNARSAYSGGHGADGVVEQVWDVEDAGGHPQEVLAAVQG
jgi:hypothetical protein